jgi:acyl-[acyl-carrier-protein]-phospholipid O-acyltransferase / long-chain-fatty-acid--[acyl-carrier-protein] ligase
MEQHLTLSSQGKGPLAKLMASLLRGMLKSGYRVQVKGLEHYPAAEQQVLLIANHVSFLDPLLLALFLPREFVIALPPHLIKNRWLRPWLSCLKAFPLNLAEPLASQTLNSYLEHYRHILLFPEGRMSTTGALMKIYPGTGWAAHKAGATILPVYIDGADNTPFSSRRRGRRRLFPQLTITLLPARRFRLSSALSKHEQRKQIETQLADTMAEMRFLSQDHQRTLFEALLEARHTYGSRFQIVEDADRQPMRYGRLLQRAFLLGNLLKQETQPGEYVGVLLPNAVNTAVLLFALHSRGRIPALLNFTTGASGLSAAIKASGLRIIYTSRRFIEAAELQEIAEILARQAQVIYLEDLRQRVGPFKLLRAIGEACFAHTTYRRAVPNVTADDPAVILFTSGSEGTPKGVVLSHTNLLANIQQVASRVDFTPEDVLLNALPVFHAFGLTIGTLLPLLSGVRLFLYPSPLHYRIVPEIAYQTNTTILFGTNTFLAGYAQYAHPYDFYSVRYVFAGAEKLQAPTRQVWAEKFGVRIFEGYGVTEASPVLAVNTALEHRPGTVGRIMPGIEYHIEPVPGINPGGRLEVRGPNVMLGYLLQDAPEQLQPPQTPRGHGWYDTGDIVSIDEDGYLTICGRAKRFAKIAGEMVSLTTVEALASNVWPGVGHAVVTLPDPKKPPPCFIKPHLIRNTLHDYTSH